MRDWRPYHHGRARRGLLVLSLAVGVLAGAADIGLALATQSALTPTGEIVVTLSPFVVVALFVVVGLLRRRWRGPHSLVIHPITEVEAAFAAVRPVAILSICALIVFWMLELLGRAVDAANDNLLWTFVAIAWLIGLALIAYAWTTTARRVVLTPTGLIVRRGLRTRSIAWTQLGSTGPATPSHSSVSIMLWVEHPGRPTPEAYSLQDKHLSVSAALLAHAIRIYVSTPDRRPLIGSPEELDRLMTELDPVHHTRHGILS